MFTDENKFYLGEFSGFQRRKVSRLFILVANDNESETKISRLVLIGVVEQVA